MLKLVLVGVDGVAGSDVGSSWCGWWLPLERVQMRMGGPARHTDVKLCGESPLVRASECCKSPVWLVSVRFCEWDFGARRVGSIQSGTLPCLLEIDPLTRAQYASQTLSMPPEPGRQTSNKHWSQARAFDSRIQSRCFEANRPNRANSIDISTWFLPRKMTGARAAIYFSLQVVGACTVDARLPLSVCGLWVRLALLCLGLDLGLDLDLDPAVAPTRAKQAHERTRPAA